MKILFPLFLLFLVGIEFIKSDARFSFRELILGLVVAIGAAVGLTFKENAKRFEENLKLRQEQLQIAEKEIEAKRNQVNTKEDQLRESEQDYIDKISDLKHQLSVSQRLCKNLEGQVQVLIYYY
jgi:hypothetical protein